MVRNTDFGRITELPRDLFIKGRAGFAFAFGVMTITGIGALQNHNWVLPDPSAMQSNADLAHMKASTDPHSPVGGQLAAYSFQSSAVENSGDKAIRKNGSTDPAPSTRQDNAHSGQGKSSLDSRYSIKDKLAAKSFQSSATENSAQNTLNSNSDPSRDSWQYCLATSRADHKVYVSSPFPKTASLNVVAIAFSQRLVELPHEPVQCPVSKYKGSIATMREDAIRFNRKIGNTIVTLNWQPFSLSDDEDPIDATIYTGDASGTAPDRSAAWQYCLAPSSADNKIYISAPFPKSASLHVNETAFAKKLRESKIQHGAVQCPNGVDESSVLSMRQRAISFNEDRGNTIVTLGWTFQSQSGS